MTRSKQANEKWIDMPLSTEGNSSRTYRSYFIVSKKTGRSGQSGDRMASGGGENNRLMSRNVLAN